MRFNEAQAATEWTGDWRDTARLTKCFLPLLAVELLVAFSFVEYRWDPLQLRITSRVLGHEFYRLEEPMSAVYADARLEAPELGEANYWQQADRAARRRVKRYMLTEESVIDGAALFLFAVCAAWTRLRLPRIPGANWPSGKAVLGFLIVGFVGGFLFWLVEALFEISGSGAPLRNRDSYLYRWDTACLFVVGSCVTAPVFEELIYRGWMLRVFGHWNWWAAVILQAVVFAAAHHHTHTRWELFHVGLEGVLLGVLYVKTSQLWVPMLCHSLLNLGRVLEAFQLNPLPW